MSTKPILFNTEMVQAILGGRKTVTRRVVKMDRPSIYKAACAAGRWSETFGGEIPDEVAEWYAQEVAKPPYHPGDVLWVRETWNETTHGYNYKASPLGNSRDHYPWHPSIHMPKAAARLFLRVKSVRVERLQEITPSQIDSEGFKEYGYSAITGELMPSTPTLFRIGWDSTIKKKDIGLYGWDANPFVWVIEFERCELPEPDPRYEMIRVENYDIPLKNFGKTIFLARAETEAALKGENDG